MSGFPKLKAVYEFSWMFWECLTEEIFQVFLKTGKPKRCEHNLNEIAVIVKTWHMYHLCVCVFFFFSIHAIALWKYERQQLLVKVGNNLILDWMFAFPLRGDSRQIPYV